MIKKFSIIIIFLFIFVGSVNAITYNQNNSFDLTTSQTGISGWYGFEIVAKSDGDITNIYKVTLNTAGECRVVNSAGTTLASGVFSGDICSVNTNISNGGTYYVEVQGSGGNSMTMARDNSASYPVSNSFIDWTYSSTNGARNSPDYAWNIQSLDFDKPILTPTIQHNMRYYYNSSNISIQLNTTTNTNMSYILDLGIETNICDECNNTILNLTGLSESLHNIIFISTDSTGQENTTTNFIIDLTKPTINIIGNMTQDFQVDFSTIFNVTDNLSGFKSCNIQIAYLENVTNPSQYDDNILCNATKTFFANGLYNGLVTAEDNAGNIETLSLNGSISTYITFNFKDISNNSITEYDLQIIKPNGEITTYTNTSNPILIYPYTNNSLILGEYILKFEKLGYLTTNFTYSIVETSGEEIINYNIQNSKIVLNIYDHTTGNLINSTTNVLLIETNYTGSTTTGTINISQINFYDGEYQIIITNDNYQTERVYFNYNNKEILNVNAYMLPSNLTNLGILNVKVQDSINSIPGQLVNLQAWDTAQSSFITIGQAKTDSNGDAFFNVELNNVLYKVVSIMDGVRIETPEQVIVTSGSVIYVIFSNSLNPTVIYDGQGISGYITNTTFNSTHDHIVFTFNDENNLVTNVCLFVNRLKGSYVTQLDEPTCTDTSGGTLEIFTSRNNTYTKEILGMAYIDDRYIKLDNLIYDSNLNLEKGLGDLSKWVVLAILISTLALGVVLGNVNILGISTIVISWATYSLFSNTISYTIPLLITIIMLLVLYGTFKKRF